MIEINLLAKKKSFKVPILLGMDPSLINWKGMIVAIVLYNVPDYFIYPRFQAEINFIQAEKDKLNKQLKRLKKIQGGHGNIEMELKAYRDQIKRLKQRSVQVDEIIGQKTNPQKVMVKIAASTPPDLWFTKMKIDASGEINFEGGSFSYKSIGRFIDKLKNTPHFGSTVSLSDTQTVPETKGGRKIRIERFKIKGKIIDFNPSSI